MSEMVRTVGLLKIHGVKIGEKMELGNYFYNFRCILTNQEELGLERFTLAVALNSEQIQEPPTEEVDVASSEEQA